MITKFLASLLAATIAFCAPAYAACTGNGNCALLDNGTTGKLAPINVQLAYKAIGDGIADDTTPIQNAINAACSAGGGAVYLPTGFYLISNVLNIPCSQVGLLGDGFTTAIINNSTTLDLVHFTGTLVAPINYNFIKHIRVYSNSAPSTSVASIAVSIVFATNFQMEDLSAANRTTQIYVQDTPGFIASNVWTLRGYPAVNSNDTYIGMRFTSTSAAVAAGFTNDQPRIYKYVSTALASNGSTYGTPQGATSYGLLYDGYNLRNLSCTDCDFDTTSYGAYVDGTNADGAHTADIRFTSSNSDGYGIAGFYFKNLVPVNGSAQISLTGGWTSAGVSGLSSTLSYGVYVANVAGFSMVGVSNIGNNNKGYSEGVYVTNSSNVQILGSSFYDFWQSVNLDASGGSVSKFSIVSNKFFEDSNAGSGQTAASYIDLNNSSDGVISNNTFNGTSSAQVTTAIYGVSVSNVTGVNNVCNTSIVSVCLNGVNVGYNSNTFGVGQSFTNVTGSRALSTTYTNPTHATIFVVAQCNGYGQYNATVNGVTFNVGYTSNSNTALSVYFPVPPDGTYSISVATSGSVASWYEFK